MSTITDKECKHLGEMRGIEDHEYELIHELGPTDPQIQAALFGASSSQVGAPSDNITQKLSTDCFH